MYATITAKFQKWFHRTRPGMIGHPPAEQFLLSERIVKPFEDL
jgi:hypothetical protein